MYIYVKLDIGCVQSIFNGIIICLLMVKICVMGIIRIIYIFGMSFGVYKFINFQCISQLILVDYFEENVKVRCNIFVLCIILQLNDVFRNKIFIVQ